MKSEKTLTIIFLATIASVIIIVLFSLFTGNEKSEKSADVKNPKVVSISTENDPYLGDKNAPIEIVNFSDFKCPWCAKWEQEVLPLLEEDYLSKGKAKLVFKNYPFLAADSKTAALAGEAIYHQDQDAFWEYINLLFQQTIEFADNGEKKSWANHDFIMNLVKENIDGLDYELLSKDIKEETYIDEVESDKLEGIKAGVQGTPTIYIKGEKVADSFDYDSIKKLIEETSR